MTNRADQFTIEWDALDPWDESYPHLWVKLEHLGRYLFASRYLKSMGAGKIIDAACGLGYGAFELAHIADDVTAVDSDPDVLNAARTRYPHDSIRYVQASLGEGALADAVSAGAFDGVVSFETIEHLLDPQRAIEEFRDLLRPEGTLVISVPNSLSEGVDDDGLPTNRNHRRVFSISSIISLVEARGFEVLDIFGQPIVAQIQRNETRLIRRQQTDGRVGEEAALHRPASIRRMALTIACPEPRDVELSYSIIVVARRV